MKFMVNERQILFRKCFFRNMQCVSTEDLKKYQQKNVIIVLNTQILIHSFLNPKMIIFPVLSMSIS